MIRPPLRVSMDITCLPPPALIIACSHTGGERVESGSWVLVESSARRMSSLHSTSVIKLSTIAAKWPLYWGIGGDVRSKSSMLRVAFGDGPLRKSSGISWPAIVAIVVSRTGNVANVVFCFVLGAELFIPHFLRLCLEAVASANTVDPLACRGSIRQE
jgi:hypothetical protein